MWIDKQIKEMPINIPILVTGETTVFNGQDRRFIAMIELKYWEDSKRYSMWPVGLSGEEWEFEFEFEEITHWMEVPEWH